jgi:hypothetical protein
MANKNFIDLTVNFGSAFLNCDLHELEFLLHGAVIYLTFLAAIGLNRLFFKNAPLVKINKLA